MSQAKIQQFSAFFDRCDTSGNGELSIQELAEGLKTQCNCKLSQAEIAEMFLGTDSNDDKKITKDEFINECVEKLPRKEAIKCHLNLLFKKLDLDNDGSLDSGELKTLFSETDSTEEEIEEAIAKADINGDGQICIKEINRVLTECD